MTELHDVVLQDNRPRRNRGATSAPGPPGGEPDALAVK